MNRFVSLALSSLLLVAFSGAVNAQGTASFGEFTQVNGAVTPAITYTNFGGGAARITSVSVPVVFRFTAPDVILTNGAQSGVDINGTLDLTVTTLSSISSGGQQVFDRTGTLSIEDATGQTLVGLTFINSALQVTGDASPEPEATFGGQDGAPIAGVTQTVSLSSDFVDPTLEAFDNTEAFNIDFLDVIPGLTIAGNNLASFQAFASGSFSALFIPEPSAITLVAIGLVGIPAFRLIRRRRQKNA